MVKILERLGHEVDYPEGQTCCGQPAFNAGYWDEARGAAENALKVFRDSEVVVSASGSCGAMMKVFYPELFAKTGQLGAAANAGREDVRILRFSREPPRHPRRRRPL